MLRRPAIALFVLLAGLLAVMGEIRAAIAVTPTLIAWPLEREEQARSLDVMNVSGAEVVCDVSATPLTPATAAGGGMPQPVPPEQLRLVIDKSEITLPPGGRVALVLRAFRSATCPAGRYLSMISVRPRTASAEEKVVPVSAVVAPIIAVGANAPVVSTQPTGLAVSVMAPFAVEANVSRVTVAVEATPLAFNGDLNSPVRPIALDVARGVDIVPAGATVEGGTGARIPYVSTGPGQTQTSASVALFNPNNLTFAHLVHVAVFWQIDTPLKEAGAYTGTVKLTGLVMPQIP